MLLKKQQTESLDMLVITFFFSLGQFSLLILVENPVLIGKFKCEVVFRGTILQILNYWEH